MPTLETMSRLSRGILLVGCVLLSASTPAAGSGDASWTSLRLPFDREQHTTIYDPIRDRIVLFGGDTGFAWDNDVWVLPLSGPPIWTKLPTAGTPPSPRVGQSAIYDPVRDRILVFGGSDLYWEVWGHYGYGNALNDVWSLSLSGTPTWSQLSPAGAPPIPRVLHTAIYDPLRDRMVVYGGWGYPGGFTDKISDVWALSLSGAPAWTQILPSGTLPPARYGHTAIYDPPRDRMVVFGGFKEGNFINPESNDVWALSFSSVPTWSDLSPPGTPPNPRARAAAIYDPMRDRMVIMGGESDAGCDHCMVSVMYDTWALSLSGSPAWIQLALPSVGRTDHAALYDPVRDRMLVVGGWDFGVHGDVLALALTDPPAWTNVTSPDPVYRGGHVAIYDPARARMVMFGGWLNDWHTEQTGFGGNALGDAWTLAMSGPPAWTRVKTTGGPPYGSNGLTAIHDPLRDRMLIFRSGFGASVFNEVWALSLSGPPTWTKLTVTGTPPSVRSGNSAIYDPVRDRMLIFGGGSGSPLNEVWELSLSGAPTWIQLTPSGTPPTARRGHVAVYDPAGDRMVVFGGRDNSSYFDDIWALTLSGTPTWSEITPAGARPSPRSGHSAILDSGRLRMVVFGGFDNTGTKDDVWALSLVGTPAWSDLLSPDSPRFPRSGHSAAYDPVLDRMVVFAGYGEIGLNDDVWALGFGGPTPTLASLISARAYRDRVELAWQIGPGGPSAATIYRRVEPGAWQSLAIVIPDGMGRAAFVDRAVTPGTRYGYRLGLASAGQESFVAETWVETPAAVGFALLGGRPNPSSGRLSASFTLPAARPAMLELMDVSGRRIVAREVGSLGAGAHTVDLTPRQALPPGMYLLRLTQGERTATARAAVLK